MQIDELIAAYHQAREDDDRLRVSRLLESLEREQYANEADWERIRAFCTQEGFDARLEIITRNVIAKGNAASGAPYFVLAGLLAKSGRVTEARPLIAQYRRLNAGGGEWDLANLLFMVEDFAQCLDVISAELARRPGQVPFLIMEARCLAGLNEGRAARRKLRDILDHLGSESGNWVWFTVVAKDFNETQLAEEGVRRLIRLLERGEARLTQSVIYALEQAGQRERLQKLIAAADPGRYEGVPACLEVFEAALRYGAQQAALRFGQAILAAEPAHELRRQIEQLAAGPVFLMV